MISYEDKQLHAASGEEERQAAGEPRVTYGPVGQEKGGQGLDSHLGPMELLGLNAMSGSWGSRGSWGTRLDYLSLL